MSKPIPHFYYNKRQIGRIIRYNDRRTALRKIWGEIERLHEEISVLRKLKDEKSRALARQASELRNIADYMQFH